MVEFSATSVVLWRTRSWTGSRTLTIALEPFDVSQLEKAVNEASSRLSVLWLSFLSFVTYLAITVGSVTHSMLFLETSIKLPLLNVDLPLVAFFIIAPCLLVIFHCYLFFQLLILARKIHFYKEALQRNFPVSKDQILLKQRLDPFLIVQFLIGQENRIINLPLRLVTFITLTLAPIATLLLIQAVFLPFHHPWVSWLHRMMIFIDLNLVLLSWLVVRLNIEKSLAVYGIRFAFLVLFCLPVAIFSLLIATHSGERIHRNRVSQFIDRFIYLPTIDGQYFPLSEALFQTSIDQVTGFPKSWFSNVLVLTGADFVNDEKVEKQERTVSVRGRDLRDAVFVRADLRKADFTGANLDRANLSFARLAEAKFGCATSNTGCTSLENALLVGANLERALLDGAVLRKTVFIEANLTGASLKEAKLENAHLEAAQLQGAVLDKASLLEANLNRAHLQGASLAGTKLNGAQLVDAVLYGASLEWAELKKTLLVRTKLQGAMLDGAQFQGAILINTRLDGSLFDMIWLNDASIAGISVWRMRGRVVHLDGANVYGVSMKPPEISAANFESFMQEEVLKLVPEGTIRERVRQRMSILNPVLPEPKDLLPESAWKK